MAEEIKKKVGFFEGDVNESSMGRLLQFISAVSGAAIFGAASIIAVYRGGDVGSNITFGCGTLVAIGIGGKAAEYFANRNKS